MSAPLLPERVAAALLAARRRREEDLSTAVAMECGMPEPELRELLAHRFRLRLPEHHSAIESAVVFHRLPAGDCRSRSVVPIDFGDGLVVATSDPWDRDLQQWLHGRLDVEHVPLMWARPSQIREWTQAAITGATTGRGDSSQASVATTARAITSDSIASSSSPVVRFVDAIILEGWRAGASDLHFETGRSGLEVRFRLDGVLVAAGRFGRERPGDEVINRIKVLAQLDVSETRVPQDGRFRAGLGDRDLDFRVSIMPSIFGEDAVVRLLDKAQLRSSDSRIDLHRLGFEAQIIERMRALALLPHGMLLVTGPTGSGKTTTLYAVLSEIYSSSEKLITIEDPVEYELPGVLQIPVNEKKGLTFARGLRSILRHDPDRILVGEIRDQETAEIAVQAALTGHLVFTTVHANNVFDVVGRFTHMRVDLFNFMAALNGVVAQRLLRLNCRSCAEDVENTSGAARVARRLYSNVNQPIRLRRGRGCKDCRETGYKGRTAIAEMLEIDDTLREMVIRRDSGVQLRAYAAQRGLKTLSDNAYALVASGATTLEEVDRVVGVTD